MWHEQYVIELTGQSTKGAEGWIPGADIQLSWVDPLRVNRETFLSP